jgi:hypothetical protein
MGYSTSMLNQRIIALKLLFAIFGRKKDLYKDTEPILNIPDLNPKSHEQRLQQIYFVSFRSHFLHADQDKFVQILKEITTGNVSPNQLE